MHGYPTRNRPATPRHDKTKAGGRLDALPLWVPDTRLCVLNWGDVDPIGFGMVGGSGVATPVLPCSSHRATPATVFAIGELAVDLGKIGLADHQIRRPAQRTDRFPCLAAGSSSSLGSCCSMGNLRQPIVEELDGLAQSLEITASGRGPAAQCQPGAQLVTSAITAAVSTGQRESTCSLTPRAPSASTFSIAARIRGDWAIQAAAHRGPAAAPRTRSSGRCRTAARSRTLRAPRRARIQRGGDAGNQAVELRQRPAVQL